MYSIKFHNVIMISALLVCFTEPVIRRRCIKLIYVEIIIREHGLMNKVSTSQPLDRGFEPHTSHIHDPSYDASTGWFQETDSRVI